MGTKIGILASTMKPEPFLFTNYNGVGDRSDKKSEQYGVLQGNALVWEIARSTSAAPGIFTPKNIVGLGKFQDGGLIHNNPIELALEEIKILCPNDPSAKRSTLKVSLGTGKAPDHDPGIYGSTLWWKDMWLFRLCRALWSSIDSEDSSNAIRHRHEKALKVGKNRRQGEYFRLNIEFRNRQPRLDDSSKMPEMKSLTQEAILDYPQLDRLAHCIIAELFVFELDLNNIPRKENGLYTCTGHILCSHRAGTPEFEALLARLTKSSACFKLGRRTLAGSIQDRSSLAQDGNFRKRVQVVVESKEDLISIHLVEKDSESCNISASPFSVQWLAEAQGLLKPFGGQDGVKRKWKNSNEGLSRKRQRV